MNIKVGSYVDFGEYGKLYVLSISGNKLRVTDDKNDVNDPNASGWVINKSFAKKVISESTILKYHKNAKRPFTKKNLIEMIRNVYAERLNEANNKVFNIKYNVGKSKYVINYHDGVKKHKDGSPFFDIQIYSNKRDFDNAVKLLKKAGYNED